MTTKINLQLDQLKKAVSRLDEALALPKTDITRDSAIQRFEFCLDLSWKTLQTYLKEQKGIIVNSPKDTFREAYQNGLIDYSDDWIKLVDLRNETTHTYDEQTAENVYRELSSAQKRFHEILAALAK
jgi:nucleotidyltransferase substrate binding protein (TIGR01987 family)